MSRNAPDAVRRVWTPHRLTLPVTVMVFLSPWFAGFFVGVNAAPQLIPVAPAAAPDPAVIEPVELAAIAPEPGSPGPTAALDAPRDAAEPPEVRALTALRSAPAAVAQAEVQVIGAPPDPLVPGSEPPDTLPDHEATGQAALGRIAFDWQRSLPGWRIDFLPANGALRGLTMPDESRIEIYVHTTDVWSVAAVTAHEIGHAVDLEHNNTASRRAWKSHRGIGAATPWWPTPGQHDFGTGAGDFAECFATWQVGSESRSTVGACSADDVEALRDLIGA